MLFQVTYPDSDETVVTTTPLHSEGSQDVWVPDITATPQPFTVDIASEIYSTAIDTTSIGGEFKTKTVQVLQKIPPFEISKLLYFLNYITFF